MTFLSHQGRIEFFPKTRHPPQKKFLKSSSPYAPDRQSVKINIPLRQRFLYCDVILKEAQPQAVLQRPPGSRRPGFAKRLETIQPRSGKIPALCRKAGKSFSPLSPKIQQYIGARSATRTQHPPLSYPARPASSGSGMRVKKTGHDHSVPNPDRTPTPVLHTEKTGLY